MYLALDIATVTVLGLGAALIIHLLIADSKDRRRYEPADGPPTPMSGAMPGAIAEQFPCANGHAGPFTVTEAGKKCERCGITTMG